MNNPLVDRYQAHRLSHATLLITDSASAQQLVDQFIQTVNLNPADYQLYKEDTPLKVAEARAIRQFAELSRFTSPIKLVFIDHAHGLTPEAANTLLKLLEEPPTHTYFILATHRPEAILPTVRSRCQVLHLNQRVGQSDAPEDTSTIPPLQSLSLAEYFALAKELAASDLPIEHYLRHWLTQDVPTITPAWQVILLRYLALCQHNPNRRLLLDNLFLEIYNQRR